MGMLITSDGKQSTVLPVNGKSFTLKELYVHVGCETVDVVSLPDGRDMWLDDDGKSKKLKRNDLASKLLTIAGGADNDFVVGNVLVTSKQESGDDDDDMQ